MTLEALPRYRCHKVVEAARIKRLTHEDGGALLELEGPHGKVLGPVFVRAEARMFDQLHEGGYYIRYEDGYASFSPANPFEAGYTLLAVMDFTPVDETVPG